MAERGASSPQQYAVPSVVSAHEWRFPSDTCENRTSVGSRVGSVAHGVSAVTAWVIGDLYQKAYAERGLAPENLSRAIEDSVTITEPLMPWTVSAVYMATTLGVPTAAYAPWAVFCSGGPVFSALYPRRGFAVPRAAPSAAAAGINLAPVPARPSSAG